MALDFRHRGAGEFGLHPGLGRGEDTVEDTLDARADDLAARYVDGVRLEPCRAIHTMGMSRSIDVVFVDEVGRVLRVAAELPPWRVARHATARAVYELPAGAAARYGIDVGRRLALWQDGAAR